MTFNRPIQIPVPFLRRQVGLGDAVASATKAVGVQPCEPCKKRQEQLNQAVQLRGWKA